MARKRKECPGVMIYFETRNCIRRLDLEDKGRLLDTILDYGENGVDPAFSDETDLALCVTWDVLRPKIDQDSESYRDYCTSRAYASYVRDCNAKGVTPLSREKWETSFDNT